MSTEMLIIDILFLGGILVFWIWSVIDVLKNEFTGSNKIVWLIIVLVLNLIGSFLYFFIGRKQKVQQKIQE